MNDKYDKLERLESAICALEEAADCIKALGAEYGMSADCCRDIMRDLQAEADDIKADIEAEEDREIAALEREYYRAVI